MHGVFYEKFPFKGKIDIFNKMLKIVLSNVRIMKINLDN